MSGEASAKSDDDEFLLIVDESHIGLPQLRGMYKGDKARKKSLVDFGFRLQSSFDNRPLKFEEIEKYFKDTIFVSATPGDYEIEKSDSIVEQIVRPTGIIDPQIEVVSRTGQLDDLVKRIKDTSENGFRALVTVLTKRMAEDLAKYLEEQKIKVCYMHADIKTPQRTELLHKLRSGVFDCLVGINLLREGLDLPEVALVAIMDADIQGFLRNTRSLIQTIGRAARNTESKVIFYADKMTDSMREAINETDRRRALQDTYNKEHKITPQTVVREVKKSISSLQQRIADASKMSKKGKNKKPKDVKAVELVIRQLEEEMRLAAENLYFEKAIEIRDKLLELQKSLSEQK
jgi:excinuclease ABC subunit B